MIKLTFPDGSKKEFKKGITAKEVAFEIGKRLGDAALAAKINTELKDLSTKIEADSEIRIITFGDKEGKEIFRHSAAHVMAQAIKKLYPKSKLTIGPAVDNAFYYDIEHEPFKPEDLEKIEKEMQKIVAENKPFERMELKKTEAKKLFKDNPYKLELIDEFDSPTVYKQGEFVDLCRGPHVPSTGYIKAFKLTKIAGAYWRGDAKNKQLQRIYGIAFPEKKELNDYLKLVEEAERRDHRKIGKDLELFSFHEEGPGFPFFHPKGMVIFNELLAFWRDEHRRAGYQEIKTPIILNRKLWEESGHWDHYKENMYFTKIDGDDYAVKPMNCPGSMLIYKEKLHSYKEFPIRMAEVGLVHRHELSGVLAGLFRVRAFTQDDAHIFITPELIQPEVSNIIDLVDRIYKKFGFDYHVELSTRPAKAMGAKELWDKAENSLKDALNSKGMKFKINPGDGAFYGPKIDFHIKDCIGRTWQCATIQLDFQMPEKFDLTYEGADGKKHRPAVLHRVVYGSVERFLGILIENYAGRFPLWLNPIQVRILTVADRFNDYAEKICKQYSDAGIRAELDTRAESIPYKVRDAQLSQVNYILVVGEQEVKNSTVNIRTRDNQVLGEKKAGELLEQLKKEIAERK